jgi:hypothetical protein
MHRSRVCHFVIDVPDPDQGVAFWSAALGAIDEPRPGISSGYGISSPAGSEVSSDADLDLVQGGTAGLPGRPAP